LGGGCNPAACLRISWTGRGKGAFVGNKRTVILVCCLALGSLLLVPRAQGQKRAIDVEHSVLRLRVYKTGFFSALGHQHEIAAPIAAGYVDDSEHAAVEFRVEAAKLRVLDPETSAVDRAKVQKTMETEVLDVAHFPEIRFQSSKVEAAGAGRWEVQGRLTLHGQTQPLLVKVAQFPGEYRGEVTIQQSGFGIVPIRIGGGAVRVKDEIKVEFAIALAK
jgi:polyisoprenoid-binding protein YceI